MNFNTALFLFLFLPFFLLTYFFAQPRWRPVVGILGSLLFYAWGSAANLAWMIGLILLNYWLGLRLKDKPAKWLLPLGLILNVGLLAAFKLFAAYGMDLFLGLERFLPERVNGWLGALTFPLGLSYVSFQLISYLLDVHKGAVKAERNLVAFAFYVLMFPKLPVGPIVRYRSLAESLPAPTLDPQQVADGARRFLRGFAKKVLIADVLAQLVNAVFALPVEASTPAWAWLGLIGYALQIFFDFSGYTDMALGLAAMMGLRFIENFKDPYIAQSIGDFWRRWHISLSTWFRDYVFYPLERKRLPVVGQSLNILTVFLLTGLWHGVTAGFVAWGLLHGIFLVMEGLFLNRWLQSTSRWKRDLLRPVRHVYALSALLLTWLVFRAPSLAYAWDFLRLMFGNIQQTIRLPFSETTPLPFIEPSFLLALCAAVALSLPIAPWLQKRLDAHPRLAFPLRVAGDLLLLALFVLAVGMMANSKFLPGIYGNF
jgi:alginate O-acetyltransferase complex protein AlgI